MGHLPVVHSGWSRGPKVLRAGDSPGNEAYLEVGWTWKQPLEIWLWSRRQSRINKNSSLQAFGKKTLAQTPYAFSVINGILTEAPFRWADRRWIHSCHCDAQHHWHVFFPQLHQRWCPVPRILHKAYLQGALQSHHPLAVWPPPGEYHGVGVDATSFVQLIDQRPLPKLGVNFLLTCLDP